MIVIKIELWPGGDESRKRELGTAEIANDGEGTQNIGHYAMRLNKWGPGRRVWKKGAIRNFPRLVLGPWDLMLRGLAAIIGARNGIEPDDFTVSTIDMSATKAPPASLFGSETAPVRGKPGHAQ